MLQWFAEIFSTNSDKARFIAILFSSIVAVAILLLNQYFINKRERQKVITEKIEELYIKISEYDQHVRDFLFTETTNVNTGENVSFLTLAIRSAEEMEMLLCLYFPNSIFTNSESLHQEALLLKNSINSPNLDVAEQGAVIETSFQLHGDKIKELRKNCQLLMTKHGITK